MKKALIDPASGDLFFYNFYQQRWEGVYNAGFHDLRRVDQANGLQVGLERNFQLRLPGTDALAGAKDDARFEEMRFKKCLHSHFIRSGISEGGTEQRS